MVKRAVKHYYRRDDKMSEREKIVENFVENIHCATYEERYLKKIINNTTLINRGRNEAESLNGFWNFCIDQYDSCLRSKWYEEKYFDEEGRQLPIDYSFDQWERIKVPSCWNMHDERYLLMIKL